MAEQPTELNRVEARAGTNRPKTRYVLVASLALIVVLFLILLFVYA